MVPFPLKFTIIYHHHHYHHHHHRHHHRRHYHHQHQERSKTKFMCIQKSIFLQQICRVQTSTNSQVYTFYLLPLLMCIPSAFFAHMEPSHWSVRVQHWTHWHRQTWLYVVSTFILTFIVVSTFICETLVVITLMSTFMCCTYRICWHDKVITLKTGCIKHGGTTEEGNLPLSHRVKGYQYSENAWGCAKWQWNARDCY